MADMPVLPDMAYLPVLPVFLRLESMSYAFWVKVTDMAIMADMAFLAIMPLMPSNFRQKKSPSR